MMNIGLFVDVGNLYYCISKKYNNEKLNYAKFMDYVKTFGNIYKAIAYGSQLEDEAVKFITRLRSLGYDTKFRYPIETFRGNLKWVDWNVGISLDVVRSLDKLDVVILASSDSNLVDLVTWIREKGIRVIVLACGISRELKDTADQYIEIKKELIS